MTTYSQLQTEVAARFNNSALYTTARIQAWINAAILQAREHGFHREIIDETLDVADDTLVYALPAAITDPRSVVEVSVEQDAGEPYNKYYGWRCVQSAGGMPTAAPTVKLYLESAFAEDAGKAIRIVWEDHYPTLTNAGDILEGVPEEFVYLYCLYLGHRELRNVPEADRNYHREERTQALQELLTLYPKRHAARARPVIPDLS